VTAENNDYERLERLFSRSNLLCLALTHSSADGFHNNQRLEFLGDAVIELAVRQHLLRKWPDASEGDLTRMKIDLVRKSTLARCADRLGLRELIITGADFSEPEVPDSMAADVYEAIAGALFEDGGFRKACDFVEQTLLKQERSSRRGDSKSLLQEYCQARGIERPEYIMTRRTGPAHAPVFEIRVMINGSVLGTGKAPSRKNAEMAAAEMALEAFEGE
jgi:ribonuclease III